MLRKRQHNRRPDVTNLLGRFGRYLTERRELENLSIRAFALRAQMPTTNVYQLENLRKNPRLTELEQLAKAFNQPLQEFLRPVLEEPVEETSEAGQ